MDVRRLRRTITDPTTGRTYPVPAGGADDGAGASGDATGTSEGDGDATGDGDDSTTSETDDSAGDDETSAQDSSTDDDGDGGQDGHPAGSKEAVLADLAKERKRRKAAEARATELERKSESEQEAHDREIREKAQAPALRALRVTAVETAARQAGFHDPADAAAFVDLDSIDVDLEADLPSADRSIADALVADLAKRKPHLVASGDSDASTSKGGGDTQGDGQQTSTDPNANLRDLMRRKIGMS